jgi:hypothetical protein
MAKGGLWQQNGTARIKSSATGVLLDDGKWIQNELISVNVSKQLSVDAPPRTCLSLSSLPSMLH